MRLINSLSISAMLAGSCFFMTPGSRALPFQSSPQGFEGYLNQIKWGEGKRVRFSNLRSCEYEKYAISNYMDPRIEQSMSKAREILRYRNSKQFTPEEKQYLSEQYDYYNVTLPTLYTKETQRTVEKYNCMGYAAITDPRGTAVCEVRANYYGASKSIDYQPFNCRWR